MLADKAIKDRKTQKVLANTNWEISKESSNTIDELLELASYAPFHYPCHNSHSTKNELTSCLPWRFYVLDSSNCRHLLKHIEKNNIDAGKISNMLAAADYLLLANWLPELDALESGDKNLFNGNAKNMEHIAGCSAAIQNVLIGATSRNIPNYWSSGGVLKSPELTEFLKIPDNEILLGALFLFPKDSHKRDGIIKSGSLRNKGKKTDTWSKWLQLE